VSEQRKKTEANELRTESDRILDYLYHQRWLTGINIAGHSVLSTSNNTSLANYSRDFELVEQTETVSVRAPDSHRSGACRIYPYGATAGHGHADAGNIEAPQ
jgi:hypothetical protein